MARTTVWPLLNGGRKNINVRASRNGGEWRTMAGSPEKRMRREARKATDLDEGREARRVRDSCARIGTDENTNRDGHLGATARTERVYQED